VNLRHAAALALVGWYLMVPPDIETNFEGIWRANQAGVLDVPPEQQFQTAPAPLSHWAVSASFDSAAECETARTRMRASASQKLAQRPKVWEETERLIRERGAGCFSTDDPRLKGR